MRKFFLLGAIALSAMSPAAFAQNAMSMDHMGQHHKSDVPVVTLSVTGIARAKPDRAMLNAGVQTKAVSAADAMAQNAKQMQSVLAALKGKGVADKDIQTSSVSLNQDYEYGEKGQIFKGYIANNSVTVRMKDIGKIGSVLDTLVNAGATNVSGPSFMVEDDSALTEKARLDAMQQAVKLSAFYAKTAGFAKARLLSISEVQEMVGPMPMANMKAVSDAGGGANTPIEPGEVASQINITVRYALEN
jgi:uncharacterized protein YggE